MAVLLKDAIKPNLVQTLEGQPAFLHCGPFANIAHGNNSLVATRVGLKLGDYVVTESGFGSDMGMEKFFDIVCRVGGLRPNAVVLVGDRAGAQAPRRRSRRRRRGDRARRREHAAPSRYRDASSGSNAVVAINRFPGDTDEEVETVKRLALEGGAMAAELNEAFERGGKGAAALAEAVVAAAEAPSDFRFLYALDDPLEAKIEAICKRVYGADGVDFLPAAQRKIEQFTKPGFDKLPICMAKTHLSLSHDPSLAERADRLHGHRPRRARVHGRGLARPAPRRHADDAGLRRLAGRLQRRHRRHRQDGRALLDRRDASESARGVGRGLPGPAARLAARGRRVRAAGARRRVDRRARRRACRRADRDGGAALGRPLGGGRGRGRTGGRPPRPRASRSRLPTPAPTRRC